MANSQEKQEENNKYFLIDKKRFYIIIFILVAVLFIGIKLDKVVSISTAGTILVLFFTCIISDKYKLAKGLTLVLIALLIGISTFYINNDVIKGVVLTSAVGDKNVEELIKKGYFKQAINIGCTSTVVDTSVASFLEGKRYYDKGQYRLAIQSYNAAIDEVKKSPFIPKDRLDGQLRAVYLNLGFAYNANNEFDKAIPMLYKAKCSASYQTVGILWATVKNNFDKSEEVLIKAKEATGDDAITYHCLINLYMKATIDKVEKINHIKFDFIEKMTELENYIKTAKYNNIIIKDTAPSAFEEVLNRIKDLKISYQENSLEQKSE